METSAVTTTEVCEKRMIEDLRGGGANVQKSAKRRPMLRIVADPATQALTILKWCKGTTSLAYFPAGTVFGSQP